MKKSVLLLALVLSLTLVSAFSFPDWLDGVFNRGVTGNVVSSSDLSGHWKFEDNFNDESGNGNTLLSNYVTFIDGKEGLGKAVSFDGIGSVLRVDSSPSLNFGQANDFTIALWLSVQSSGKPQTIVSKGVFNNALRGGYFLQVMATGKPRIILQSSQGQGFNCIVDGEANLNDAGWKHLAVVVHRGATCDSNSVEFYVEGVRQSVSVIANRIPTNTGLNNPNPFRVGGRIVWDGTKTILQDFFKGQIDELRVYQRGLSGVEVKELAQGGSSEECTDTDGGVNYFVKGTTMGIKPKEGFITHIDYCNLEGAGVVEGYCKQDPILGLILDLDSEPCPDGCIDGACIQTAQTYDLEISIATLKDEYSLGEPIQLTDPPEEISESGKIIIENSFQQNLPSISGITQKDIQSTRDLDSREMSGERVQSRRQIVEPTKQLGYIITLKEKPLLIKQKELKEEAKANEQYIDENPLISTITAFRFRATTSEDVPSETQKHKNRLLAEHSSVKVKIKDKLQKSGRITGRAVDDNFEENILLNEFQNIYNGIAIDITEEEAKEIESLPEVEKVSSNRLHELKLMDSAPLIGADQVWETVTDSQGSPITGEGVTIAILDTGVDYTHPDLGCINDERCGSLIFKDKLNPSIYEDKIVWEDYRNYDNVNFGNGDIYMYDLSTQQETQITTDLSGQSYPAIYGNKIVWKDWRNIDDSSADIYMCNLEGNNGDITSWCNTLESNGGGLKQITGAPFQQQRPAIYEDKIVWQDFRNPNIDWDIYMYDLSTQQETQITNAVNTQWEPAIYEDKIVWQDWRNDDEDAEFVNTDIYMYDLSTQQETPITNNLRGAWEPAIYGDKIVWEDTRNDNSDIYMYDLSTQQEIQITDKPTFEGYPAIYGDKIVWEAYKNGNFDIYMCNLEGNNGDITSWCNTLESNGGGVKRITDDLGRQWEPKIYGDRIVWTDYRRGIPDIYMYDLSTQEEIQIGTRFPFIRGLFPNEKIIGGYDFSNNDPNPFDYHGHGTHVAATAAGNGLLKGIAPDASILFYKVFPNAYDDVIISAIEQAVLDGADVISMSLGFSCLLELGGYTEECGPDDPESQAIDDAVSLGVTVVVAAGNDGLLGFGEGTIGSPGTARKAITVGASDKSDRIAGFSSIGPVRWRGETIVKPDVTAPGVSICAARYDSAFIDFNGNVPYCLAGSTSHAAISGTSMATPHVAGAAALIKQAHPDWTPEQIKTALMDSAVDLGLDENIQGAGRIDVAAALGVEPEPPVEKPQSKIVNNGNVDLIVDLRIKVQKEVTSDIWADVETPVNQQVTIPANGLIKLDSIFNPLGVSVDSVGEYRVVASLTDSSGNVLKDLNDNLIEASWEFSVN